MTKEYKIETEEQRKWYLIGKSENLEDLAFYYGLILGIIIGIVIMLIIFDPMDLYHFRM